MAQDNAAFQAWLGAAPGRMQAWEQTEVPENAAANFVTPWQRETGNTDFIQVGESHPMVGGTGAFTRAGEMFTGINPAGGGFMPGFQGQVQTDASGNQYLPTSQYNAELRRLNTNDGFSDFMSKYGPLLAIGGGFALGGVASGALGGAAGASGGGAEALSGMDLAADAGSLFAGNGAFAGGGATAPSMWQQLAQFVSGKGGSGGGAGSMSSLLGGPLSTAWSLGSGLYGMKKSKDMQKIAAQAASMQDPFGPYRAGYANDLRALMSDPSRITSMPGYKAGLDAVERKMASQGYLGSGNMMAALQKYGGDFFNQETARLAQLAGAQFGPSGGSALISGNISSNDLASKALASLGYGIRQYETQGR